MLNEDQQPSYPNHQRQSGNEVPSVYDEPVFVEHEDTRIWTVRRVIYLIISILVLIAFLVYLLILPLVATRPRSPTPRVTPTTLPRF